MIATSTVPSAADMTAPLPNSRPLALVAEDDAITAIHECDMLEEIGFKTIDAPDGQTALQKLEKIGSTTRLLVSDIDMPGRLDGVALARVVAWRWPHINIVIVSGRVQPRPGELPRGAIFLRKPFTAASLAQWVARALRPPAASPALS